MTPGEELDSDDEATMAALASASLGRPVARQLLDDDALRSKMATRGAPPSAAAIVLGLYAASRGGEFAAVDPTLERLLGRAPVTLRALIDAKVSALR